LTTTCNKNEQQQDAKNNAELYTKWTKTTWKIFEELLDEDETCLSTPDSWRMMMICTCRGQIRVLCLMPRCVATFYLSLRKEIVF